MNVRVWTSEFSGAREAAIFVSWPFTAETSYRALLLVGDCSMKTVAYDITCSKDIFDIVKNDPRFWSLLTLGRFVNALRFIQKAKIDSKGTTGPASARSSINSFLFAASILYEGFLLVDKLAKNFKDLDSYKSGFGALLRDKMVRSLRESVLNRIRNKFVFHFDEKVAKESLENFELTEYKFASGIGTASGDMVFVLADEVVMNYLLQPTQNETDEILRDRYWQILQDATTTIGRFLVAAEELMAEVLIDMGFEVKFHK
jgi:hypothetical protein